MESLAESMPEQATTPRFEDGSINLRELIGALAEDAASAMMDAEADQLCAGGANGRDGYRERNPATCVGGIALRIPKLRSGSFLPEDAAERCRRVGRAAASAAAEMHAAYVKCRRGGRACSTAAVAATGCDEGGWRHAPGPSAVDTEPCDSRLGFLRAIGDRGARGAQLVTSNAHKGLVRAIEEVFRGATWQRRAVHLMRDCMREAGSRQLKRRVGRMLSSELRAKDAATARAMYHVARDMLRDCRPKAAAVAEEAEPGALAYLGFPPSHWKRLRTSNVQERADRETKRRSRVVQVFPSEKSLERLVGAVVCEQDEIRSESRCFAQEKTQELCDGKRAMAPAASEAPAAELAAEARKMTLASLELAERVEAA